MLAQVTIYLDSRYTYLYIYHIILYISIYLSNTIKETIRVCVLSVSPSFVTLHFRRMQMEEWNLGPWLPKGRDDFGDQWDGNDLGDQRERPW